MNKPIEGIVPRPSSLSENAQPLPFHSPSTLAPVQGTSPIFQHPAPPHPALPSPHGPAPQQGEEIEGLSTPFFPPLPDPVKYEGLYAISKGFGNGMHEMLLTGAATALEMSRNESTFYSSIENSYKKTIKKQAEESAAEEAALAKKSQVSKYSWIVRGPGQMAAGVALGGAGIVSGNPALMISGGSMIAGASTAIASIYTKEDSWTSTAFNGISTITALAGAIFNADYFLSEATVAFSAITQVASIASQTHYRGKAIQHQENQQMLSGKKEALDHARAQTVERQRALIGTIRSSSAYIRAVRSFSDYLDSRNEVFKKITTKGG